jgi:hypothetical protein
VGLTSFFSTILSKPLDERLTALTCHHCEKSGESITSFRFIYYHQQKN